MNSARLREGVETPAKPATPSAAEELARGLGLLRLFGLLLIVAGHASIGYASVRMPSVLWLIYHDDPSSLINVFCYFAMSLALPLFFLIAGLSASFGHAGKRAGEFLRLRSRRVLLPFLFAAVTILPCTYAVWSLGFEVGGRRGMTASQRAMLETDIANADMLQWGPMHLWFLEYLFLISVGYCLVRWLGSTTGLGYGNWRQRLLGTPWRPVWFALPTAMVLFVDLSPWSHLFPTPVPSLTRLVYFATYFAAGLVIAGSPNTRRVLLPWSKTYLALSIVPFSLVCWLAPLHFRAPLQGAMLYLLAGSVTLFNWLMLFGLLGLSVRWTRRLHPILQYLLEASFWIYLAHLPIVGLVQIELSRFHLPAVVAFALTSLLTLLLTLVLYEAFVRYRRLGTLLNGRAKRKSARYYRRLPYRRAAGAVALLLGIAGAVHLANLARTRNLHEVVAGKVFRSAQLSTAALEETIQRHGILAVVSLRGGRPNRGWYREQVALCEALGVEAHTVRLPSGGEPPSREILQKLIETLENSPRPVLLHGHWGFGRAALGGACALLLEGESPSKAAEQFSIRYGYWHSLADHGLHVVMRQYRNWLDHQDVPTSSAALFRRWIDEAYIPGFFGARIEMVGTPAPVEPGSATALRLLVTNISPLPWRQYVEPGRGIRVVATIERADSPVGSPVRLFEPGDDARIPSGGHREMVLTLPPQSSPGRYRVTVDLFEEERTSFKSMGSEPLVLDLEQSLQRPAARSGPRVAW